MNIQHKIIARLFQKAFWDKYINDKQGFVLILTMLLISLMSVLTITTFELVTSTTRITGNHKTYLQSLYVADAGVEHALYVLSKTVTTDFDWSDSSFQNLGLAAADNSTNSVDWVSGSGHWEFTEDGTVWVPGHWAMANNELSGSYSVILTMDAVKKLFIVESLGTASGFQKTIVAEITNSPSAKITTWMEKEM